MSSENLHAPRELLSRRTLLLHNATVSMMEEMEAADWYRQRAEDTDDEALREILLHNMREEIEHASMILEWIRRHDGDWDRQLRTYLFTEEPILEVEKKKEAEGSQPPGKKPPGQDKRGFTIGRLRED